MSAAVRVPVAPPAVEVAGLVQRFGRSYALRGTSLRLERGEALALYGANGAGKTTLLRILVTALSPTRGGGRILGHDLRDARPIRARTLLVSHALGLYPDLDGPENLAFALALHGRAPDGIPTALDRVGLGRANARVRGYSSGMRKRLALAKALLLEPELVLLDEPFAALDPDGRDMVEAILREQRARGATLLIASHEPERARRVATLETTLRDGLLAEPTPVPA